MAEDENGEPMHTLAYKGYHVVFKEPLTPEEMKVFKKLLSYMRAESKKKDGNKHLCK